MHVLGNESGVLPCGIISELALSVAIDPAGDPGFPQRYPGSLACAADLPLHQCTTAKLQHADLRVWLGKFGVTRKQICVQLSSACNIVTRKCLLKGEMDPAGKHASLVLTADSVVFKSGIKRRIGFDASILLCFGPEAEESKWSPRPSCRLSAVAPVQQDLLLLWTGLTFRSSASLPY